MKPRKHEITFDELMLAHKAVVMARLTTLEQLILAPIVVYMVDARRGRAKYADGLVTIPRWALKGGTDYVDWYVAHELCHFLSFRMYKHRGHSLQFELLLRRATPNHKFEANYKPSRYAAAAGITEAAAR
jgi:hypothetical protein